MIGGNFIILRHYPRYCNAIKLDTLRTPCGMGRISRALPLSLTLSFSFFFFLSHLHLLHKRRSSSCCGLLHLALTILFCIYISRSIWLNKSKDIFLICFKLFACVRFSIDHYEYSYKNMNCQCISWTKFFLHGRWYDFCQAFPKISFYRLCWRNTTTINPLIYQKEISYRDKHYSLNLHYIRYDSFYFIF